MPASRIRLPTNLARPPRVLSPGSAIVSPHIQARTMSGAGRLISIILVIVVILFFSAHNFRSSDPVIENKNIHTEDGVNLSERQKTLVGSILDLFAGRPSLEKLQLWKDDATFEDPIAKAHGRKEFEAQWYGLQTAFSAIERLSHSVISDGNPIKMNLKTKYTVKGINQAKIMDSVVHIQTEPDAKSDDKAKIALVQDKWNGDLPEGQIAEAFRRLNAKTMPNVIGVPKNKEEDAAKGNP